MILDENTLKQLPIITESEMDNLYAVGEFETILIAELNNDFDEIDAQMQIENKSCNIARHCVSRRHVACSIARDIHAAVITQRITPPED